MRTQVRLDRALSKLGLASRADAQRMIRDGLVTVSGRIVTNPARLVQPNPGAVTVAGRAARTPRWRTIAFHKPRGVVTTKRDPEGRRTVFDALGADADGLVAVGRLDMASTGLLVLTTDTALAAWLTDPANAVPRRYVVTARGAVTDDDVRAMERGIDGLHARSVDVRKQSKRESHLIIELTEGKNREIRRLLEAVGHEVTRLLRISFGTLGLGTLQPGEWREITREDLVEAFPLSPFARRRADRSPSPAAPAPNQRRGPRRGESPRPRRA